MSHLRFAVPLNWQLRTSQLWSTCMRALLGQDTKTAIDDLCDNMSRPQNQNTEKTRTRVQKMSHCMILPNSALMCSLIWLHLFIYFGVWHQQYHVYSIVFASFSMLLRSRTDGIKSSVYYPVGFHCTVVFSQLLSGISAWLSPTIGHSEPNFYGCFHLSFRFFLGGEIPKGEIPWSPDRFLVLFAF